MSLRRRHPIDPVKGHRLLGQGNDEGSTSLELVIVFPAVLLLITALMQYGLWFFARTVALSAAQEGVTAARVLSATAADGVARAEEYVAHNGSDTLFDVAVEATSPAPGTVAVEVRGRSLSVIPGMAGIAVVQSAQGPVEAFKEAGSP